MLRGLAFSAALLAAGAALAEDRAPATDLRIAPAQINALAALLNLREAELQVTIKDYEARLDTAMEWLKAAQSQAKAKK